jgi:hypothetical protein
MNYSNDFYSQNTYDNHIKYDHVSQQTTIIEAIDSLIINSPDESLDDLNEDYVPQ